MKKMEMEMEIMEYTKDAKDALKMENREEVEMLLAELEDMEKIFKSLDNDGIEPLDFDLDEFLWSVEDMKEMVEEEDDSDEWEKEDKELLREYYTSAV